nr:zinc finger, CCHC-type, retrotransposon Gag domain protein [Tanacetum cinerariifolium]
MVSEPGYETVGSKDLTYGNTRTDADLSAAVQNSLQTLLPQIHAEIREEFRTSSGPSDTAPVDAENWISHMEKIFDVMGCEDAFKTRLAVYKFEGNALAWWKAYKQAKGGDAWQKSSDRHQPTSQQSIHRSHGHNNDHHRSDRCGGSDNHRSSNNNYSDSNN